MKTVSMPSVIQIGAEDLKTLLTEVKETIATGYQAKPVRVKRNFRAIDMWKIQRGARSTASFYHR